MHDIPHFGIAKQYANLKEELLEATDLALKSGCWNDGINAELFSVWLKEKTKTKHAILCHSGTQALELIARYEKSLYKSTDNPDWDVIRVPNFTYPATANAFINSGMRVNLCDVDSNGILITPKKQDHIQLSCYVGLYGAPILELLEDEETIAIDYVDGAQHWLIADGNIGSGMAISFDPTKNLPASGNGGALVTNNQRLATFARQYVNHGKSNTRSSVFLSAGTNSKLSEQDCAHLLVKTKYIDQWQERRKQIRLYYIDRFKNLHEDLYCMSQGFEKHADQKFVLKTHTHRDPLVEYLRSRGIDTKIHYDQTLSEMIVGSLCDSKPDLLSTGHALSRAVLSLPIYFELTDNEIEFIADTVTEYFTQI